MKTISQSILKLFAIMLLISASFWSINNLAWAAKMYKWVDADGKISYQDKPPPKSGKLIETSELKKTSSKTSAEARNQSLTPLTAYTIPNCEACNAMMTFLKKAKVPVVELSLQDRDVQSRILALSGKISAPTLFIGNAIVSDISEPGLIRSLKRAGYALPASIDPESAAEEEQERSESSKPSKSQDNNASRNKRPPAPSDNFNQ